MNDLATLGIVVDATQVSAGAKKLDDLTRAGKTATAATHLLREAVKLAGEAFGAIKLAEFVRDAAEAGIRAQTLGIAMRVIGNNAGYSFAQMQNFQKQVQAFNFSSNQAGNILTKLAAAQIDVGQAAKLAGEAQGLATVANISGTEAFDNLTSAILSGRAIQLRQMGLSVDFTTAQLKLAQSLGKTTEELTENQKIQANLNTVLERAPALTDVYKESIDSAGGKIRTLTDNWEELETELGKDVLPATTALVGALADAIKYLNEQVENKDEWGAWSDKIEKGIVSFLKNDPFTQGLGDLVEYLDGLEKTGDAVVKNTEDNNDYKASIEAYAIAMGKADKAAQEKADTDAKRLAADKDAAKTAQEAIDALSKELIAMYEGELASKHFAIALEAAKAPTKELAAAIKQLGDELIYGEVARSPVITDILKEYNAQLTETIKNTQTLVGFNKDGIFIRHPENELLSLKSINDADGPKVQGHGSGQTLIDNNPLPFKIQDANAYLDILERVRAQTERASASMADSFGSVGKAVGDLSNVMANYHVEQQTIETKRLADLQNIATRDKANATAAKSNAEAEINYQGDLLHAAKGFFSEKSAIYKGLQVAETAYRAIQLAGAIQAIAANATETASATAAAGTQATGWGITAMARALASAPPPWNFVYMAAVGAALTGIGVALSGNGGSQPGTTDAADRQKAAGTGGVLGDSSAKSASITKAIEQASKNSNTMLEYNGQMVSSLKKIEENISSFTNIIARNIGLSTGGVFDTSKLGLGTSKGAPSFLVDPFGLGNALGLDSKHTTKSLQDFGLDFASQSLSSLVADGVLAKVYQQILTSSSTNVLGIKISSSSKVSAVTSNITDELANQVVSIVSSLKGSVLGAASVLGVTGAEGVLDAFQVSLGKLSFQGLTGSEIQDELNAVFGKLGDDLASTIVPALKDFQNVGEGAFETLVRLAREYQVVDVTLASIGLTFKSVGISSLAARDNLVKLAGDLDTFTSEAKFYAENFLTEQEQLAPITRAVTLEMARLGQSGVQTKQQFVNLINSIDLTTDSGAILYSSLLKVAPAFARVADAATDTFNNMVSDTAKAIDVLIDSSSAAAQKAHAASDTYKSASKAISDAIAQIRGLSSNNSLSFLRAQFGSTLAAALGGNVSALQALPRAAVDFANASKTGSATQAALRRDLASITNGLAQAGITSDDAAAALDYQAQLYDVQTEALKAIQGTLNATEINQGLLAQQIVSLNQINTSIGGDNAAVTGVLGSLGAISSQLLAQSNMTQALSDNNTARAAADGAAQIATVAAAAIAEAVQEAIAPAGVPTAGPTVGPQGAVSNIRRRIGLGFASGGSFMVGGNGGTDSQYVNFRASPNERVTVQTPQQVAEQKALLEETKKLQVKLQNVERHTHTLETLLRQMSPDGNSLNITIVADETA